MRFWAAHMGGMRPRKKQRHRRAPIPPGTPDVDASINKVLPAWTENAAQRRA